MRATRVVLGLVVGATGAGAFACTSDDSTPPLQSIDAGGLDVTQPTFDVAASDVSVPDSTAPGDGASADAPPEASSVDAGEDASDAAVLDASDAGEASTLMNGLVAWWRAEGNAADSVGAYNGTLVSTGDAGVTFVPGRDGGQAFSFPGDGAEVQIPDGIISASPADFTVAAWTWLNPAALNNQQHVIFYQGSLAGELDLTVDNQNLIDFSVRDSTGTWQGAYLPTFTDGGSPATAAWVSLVGVRRGTVLELWVGHVLVGTGGIGATTGAYLDDAGTHSSIGGHDNSSQQYWWGYLDDVRVYSRALSAAEIQSL